jgi:hypothetical protein
MFHGIQHTDPYSFDVVEKTSYLLFPQFGLQVVFWRFAKKEKKGGL